MHTKIPLAEIRRGKYHRPEFTISCDEAEITRQAQVLSAKDPKRSDPIPAISPTLSPTLSAMTPGFSLQSSGRPAITLPARSEPTSAALVYIPPPTLPKRAITEPPRPYPAMFSKISLSSKPP
jgi:hypothetical protein